MSGGWHCKNGHSSARPFLQVSGVETAGDDAGDKLGGCWSLGNIEIIESEGIRFGVCLLQHLHNALKLMVVSDGPTHHRNITDD